MRVNYNVSNTLAWKITGGAVVAVTLFGCLNSTDAGTCEEGVSDCNGSDPLGVEEVDLVAWSIAGVLGNLPIEATSNAQGVVGHALTAAESFGFQPEFSDVFAVTSWPAEAGVDLARFFEFGLTSEVGTIGLNELKFSVSSTNAVDGTGKWQIRSSMDDFASIVDEGSVPTVASPGTRVAADLSSVEDVTGEVVFRLYLFENQGDSSAIRGIRGENGDGSSLVLTGFLE